MYIKRTVQVIGIAVLLVVFVMANALTSAQEASPEMQTAPMDTAWWSDFSGGSIEQFMFSAVEDNVTTVIIIAEETNTGIIANLIEVGNFTTISSMNLNVAAATFCVPAGDKDYILTIENPNSGNDADAYEAIITNQPTAVCSMTLIEDVLETVEVSDVANNDNDNEEVEEDEEDEDSDDEDSDDEQDDEVVEYTCTASPTSRFGSVNMRDLPTTASSIVAVVNVDTDVNITGQALSGTWLEARLFDGRTGYISASVLSIAEVCVLADVPLLDIDLAEIEALEASVELNSPVDATVDVTIGEDGVTVDTTVGDVDVNVDVNTDDGINVNVGGDDGDGGIDVNIGGNDGDGGVDVNIRGDGGVDVGLP